MGGHRCEPAGLLDTRPQFPDGAEFRDGEELVGIRRKPEIDQASAAGSALATFERTMPRPVGRGIVFGIALIVDQPMFFGPRGKSPFGLGVEGGSSVPSPTQ